MTLLQKIKADQLQARKDKREDMTSTLTTLIAQIEIQAKNENRLPADTDCILIIKRFLKTIEENLSYSLANEDKVKALKEKETLLQYMPKQLTRDELVFEIKNQQGKTKGEIMKHLKSSYDGQYDGKSASVLIDELILSK